MPEAWEDGLQSAIADLWKVDPRVADFLGATGIDVRAIALPEPIMSALRSRRLQATNADPTTMGVLRLMRSHAVILVQEVVDTNTAVAIAHNANAGPEKVTELDTALAILQGADNAPLTMLAWQTRALLAATQPVQLPKNTVSTVYALARWAYAYHCHRMLTNEHQSDAAVATLAAKLA